MGDTAERIRCPKCGMTFVVGEPPSIKTEVGTCGEPDCRRVHWTRNRSGYPSICGVWPERSNA